MTDREVPRGSKGLDGRRQDDTGLCISQSKEDQLLEKGSDLLSGGRGRLGVRRRHLLLHNCQSHNCEVGGLCWSISVRCQFQHFPSAGTHLASRNMEWVWFIDVHSKLL